MFCSWLELEVDSSEDGDNVHVLGDGGIERNSLYRSHLLVEGHVISTFPCLQGNNKGKFDSSSPLIHINILGSAMSQAGLEAKRGKICYLWQAAGGKWYKLIFP